MAEKKMITKDDLVEQLAKVGRMQKGDAKNVIEALFVAIASGLKDPEYGTVKIAGFGQFSLVERQARVGVNPANKDEKIEIPASLTVKFKPSKTLKDLVNEK